MTRAEKATHAMAIVFSVIAVILYLAGAVTPAAAFSAFAMLTELVPWLARLGGSKPKKPE